ncbi:NKD inhibitor of WNT signaling pathway naked cuticle [Musca autumnalis]|uniref:NKD inhibitor of WNT signaling pathway naked cuticle n=1 Tax=Musca autumnalis TaxID=221902 RepID=UPI003CED2B12
MAGNLVKWWKHKFLGGYKQFSVQECATDSEELIYHQVRASSSCSAPPDLLLVSDRENNLSLRSGTAHRNNVPSTTASPLECINTCPSSNNNVNESQQQHQQVQKHSSTCRDASNKHLQKSNAHRHIPADLQEQHIDGETSIGAQQSHSSARYTQNTQQQRPDEHIRLEEFTCDVSVEGGKASQPLQFSFTFYDLDGHHGKITKDDIVGIVYTIYESIGKSVVVPHSGSKTINVRLTVSPEDKTTKTSTTKQAVSPNPCALEQQNVSSNKISGNILGRKSHRYRPRKLIKSDEEDDDSASDKERETGVPVNSAVHLLTASSRNRLPKSKPDQQCFLTQQQVPPNGEVNMSENIYNHAKKGGSDACRQCLTVVEEHTGATVSPGGPTTHHLPNASKTVSNEAFMKHAALTRMKLLRKSRKQKQFQDCTQIRQRSLSVGNEACWNNRHLQKTQNQHQLAWVNQQLNNTDVLDGVQMRNTFQTENTSVSQIRSSAECWKTPLNRNDLISIIRESMEKNRLCFQLNGKPQANVSPIRQQTPQHQTSHKNKHIPSQTRQKTKIPMLIANHSNRSINLSNNNESSLTTDHLNGHSIIHHQAHIPMFQQQMGLNSSMSSGQNGTSVLSGRNNGQHGKMNLCGYDSFLHATICSGGAPNHTAPILTLQHNKPINQTNDITNTHTVHNPQIATVPPSTMPTLAVQPHTEPKHLGQSATSIHNTKISKSPRNMPLPHVNHGNTTGHTSSQNSPQYHGYQRLPSGSKHSVSSMNLNDQGTDKVQNQQSIKFRSNHMQNYELYAKLTEKLQQTSLATCNKENIHRRNKHRLQRQRRSNGTVLHANKSCDISLAASSKTEGYASLLPFSEDPMEFQNLIAQTSEDECHSQHENIESETNDNQNPRTTIHVAEGTLVDLELEDENDQSATTKQHCIGNIQHLPPTVDVTNNKAHVEDDLEIDDDLDEDLVDLGGIAISESGRNSSISNDANDTIANTSATSSLIHRYVHEHIHHHYHHFEEKDE